MNSFKISGIIRDVKEIHASILEVTIENRQVLGGRGQTNFYKVSFFDLYTFLPEYSPKLVVGTEIEVEGHLSVLANYEDQKYDSLSTKTMFVPFLATDCKVLEKGEKNE